MSSESKSPMTHTYILRGRRWLLLEDDAPLCPFDAIITFDPHLRNYNFSTLFTGGACETLVDAISQTEHALALKKDTL